MADAKPEVVARNIALLRESLPVDAAGQLGKRRRRIRSLISGALGLGDLIAMVIGFTTANLLVYGLSDLPQIVTVLLASIPMLIVFSLHDNAYSARIGIEASASVFRALKTIALVAASLMFLAFLFKVGAEFSRAQFVIGTILSAVLMVGFRLVIAKRYSRVAADGLFADMHIFDEGFAPIGPTTFSVNARAIGLSPDRGDSAAIARLSTLAKGMDRVIMHCAPTARDGWAKALKSLDCPTEIVMPELDALKPLGVAARDGHTSIILSGGQLNWEQQALKRAFDLAIVVPTLPLLLPLFCLIGLIIKLDSPGPMFFRQERIGLGNRTFCIWKFRSMKISQQDDKASKLTERNDVRVTRVGQFIRRTSIDELPQLFNVLVGDMSLVGPRPHAPLAKAGSLLYWEVDHDYWERHVVKPGITGLAQVRGFRGNTFVEDNLRDRLQADLEYVADWSLILDLRILLGTVVVPFGANAF